MSESSLLRKLLIIGLLIPLLLMTIEYYMSPYKEYKPTKLGIRQQKIKRLSDDKN